MLQAIRKKPALVKPFWIALFVIIVLHLPSYAQPLVTPTQAYQSNVPQKQLETFLLNLKTYPAISASSTKPLIYSKAYALLDGQTGEVLIQKNGDLSLPVASTTKMTTALVAEESLPLDEVVTISPKATAVIGSGINLQTGEKMTVHDLLRGLLVQSGNDAAVALEEYYNQKQGSDQAFVKKMNQFLAEHSLTNTAFADPAGLDDQNGHSTAINLGGIARLLLTRPTLAAIVKTSTVTLYSTDGNLRHDLKNSNRLVVPDNPYYMSEAIGVKTGFTPDAGHCMVGAVSFNGHSLIGVVLNTNESTLSASAAEMKKLFTWAEHSVTWRTYIN